LELATKFYRTHLFLGKPDTEENRAAFVSTIPLGRPSTPADVANTCSFLASDEAEFITGVELEVSNLDRAKSVFLTLFRWMVAAVCDHTDSNGSFRS
jgi:hypothetical protein